MRIERIKDASKLIVQLEGRLDASTAPILEKVIKEELNGVTELEIDMKELSYISSAGLRVLLAAQKKMKKQGKMSILNVCEAVMEVFEITGLDKLFVIG